MREARLGILRWSLILLLAAGLGVGSAGAQLTDSLLIRIDAWGSIDRVALYDGDATVGGYSTWGGALSLGLRSPFPIGAELFLSFSPRNNDPRLLSLRFDVRFPGSSSVSEQAIPRFGFGTGLRVW